MFRMCHDRYLNFKVGETLKGVIMDWSDAEARGLREAVGDETAESILRGCNVHYIKGWQRELQKKS